jgi:hypothetical protein
MTDKQLKQIGHIIRWSLELAVIWLFALSETGVWTSFVLTMITVGIEWDHLDFEIWKKT